MNTKLIFTLILISALFISCKKDKEADSDNLKINQWIFNEMSDVYFWNSDISITSVPSSELSPDEYFNSLLKKPEDKWSYIVENFEEYRRSMAGNPESMGFDFALWLIPDTERVMAVVKFVYKDSPSQVAGIKRGDIIIAIDDVEINTDNYRDIFNKSAYTVTLGKIVDQDVESTGVKLSMTAAVLDINPVICEKVFSINGQKIGYLAISEFLNEENFIEKVKPSLINMKSNNIDDIIVDLRYNLGGDLKSAVWLASALAPYQTSLEGSLFVELIFNENLQEPMEIYKQSHHYFEWLTEENLDLNRVCFLTTNFSTASASECVITGLEPYTNVIQVGENTIGKFMGMWVIAHEDNYWGMLPLVFKYANAEGFTDFEEGLVPDIYLDDMGIFAGIPLGDESDPMIAEALEQLTGVIAKKTHWFRPEFISLKTSDQQKRQHTYILR